MKKSILVALIIAVFVSSSNAQEGNNFPPSGNVWLDGAGVLLGKPTTLGGWARGVQFYSGNSSDPNEILGEIGILGQADNVINLHMAHGKSPWNSRLGIYVIPNGNVGIGTLSPDSKLTVKGKIHAEEVKIDLAVPADYVFQKYYLGASSLKADYVMPTLEEVEAYTKANHHLPEVPSAKQLQEEGLQVGEMTNILLQKIEELTLYTIEQQAQLKEQQALLKAQNSRIEQLEKIIK